MQENTTPTISPDGQWLWNGTDWVPNADSATTAAPQPPVAERPKKKKRRGLKITGGVVAAVVALAIATGGGADSSTDTPAPAAAVQEQPAQDEQAAEQPVEAVEEPAAEAAPEMTVSQENAVESAESYLDYTGFSRQGLIHQLSSDSGEGFSKADATFAVDYLEDTDAVDWNAEAVESAKSYMDYSSFSRQGLIHQLESDSGEGFTHKQAVHGANEVGL